MLSNQKKASEADKLNSVEKSQKKSERNLEESIVKRLRANKLYDSDDGDVEMEQENQEEKEEEEEEQLDYKTNIRNKKRIMVVDDEEMAD